MFWAQTPFLHHHFRRKEEKGAQTSGEIIGKWGTHLEGNFWAREKGAHS